MRCGGFLGGEEKSIHCTNRLNRGMNRYEERWMKEDKRHSQLDLHRPKAYMSIHHADRSALPPCRRSTSVVPVRPKLKSGLNFVSHHHIARAWDRRATSTCTQHVDYQYSRQIDREKCEPARCIGRTRDRVERVRLTTSFRGQSAGAQTITRRDPINRGCRTPVN